MDKVLALIDTLEDALATDLENGVKWLNETAASTFVKTYPSLSAAITELLRYRNNIDG